MKRTLDDFPHSIPEKAAAYPGRIEQTYAINVITPLFGGGVEAGIPDPITQIRPSSIRGHLRFWWRATRGAKYEDVRELRQREGEIWGAPTDSSLIIITVENSELDPTPCAHYPWNHRKRHGQGGHDLKWYSPLDLGNSLPYALFPFQGKAPDSDEPKNPAQMIRTVKFCLKIWLPTSKQMKKLRLNYNEQREKKQLSLLDQEDDDIQNDLEGAIWAWVNFGGIGARTRRGCGALYCSEFAPPSTDAISTWFATARETYRFPSIQQPLQWPTLQTPPLVLRNLQLPIQAWNKAIALMQDFRQGKIGRKTGTNSPGRSYWPEADSLRNITGKGELKHLTTNTLARPIDPAFPRAELGLPIVFHFKDSGDTPNNCELYPNNRDRLASPLILRPLAIGNGEKAIAMVMLLTTPLLQALELKKVNYSKLLNSTNIRRPDLAGYHNSPLGPPTYGQPPRSATGSALEAFLAYAQEQGFI